MQTLGLHYLREGGFRSFINFELVASCNVWPALLAEFWDIEAGGPTGSWSHISQMVLEGQGTKLFVLSS